MSVQLVSTPTLIQHIQHERFATKQHDCELFHLSLSSSGNIAVSGFLNNGRTFVDLYCWRTSDARDKWKLFFSKEFEKYLDYLYRYISFLGNNDNKIVSCIGGKLEIFDTKNDKVLRSYTVSGETRCLAVRKGEIFIALKSLTVIEFNHDLKEKKRICLKGIEDTDCPWDFQVIKDTVFVCTLHGKVHRYQNKVRKYTYTTEKYINGGACSITVSEELGLVAVLWGRKYADVGDRIIVYSFKGNKSFLAFDVDSNIFRIRFSDRDKMIITGNKATGEIKMYDLALLLTYEHMKVHLASELTIKDLEELAGLCLAAKNQLDSILKSNTPAFTLLRALETEGVIESSNVDILVHALTRINPSCYSIVHIYQKTRRKILKKGDCDCHASKSYKTLLKQIKASEEAWDDERKQLKKELEELKMESSTKIEQLEGALNMWKWNDAIRDVEINEHKEQPENTKLTLEYTNTQLKVEFEKLRKDLEEAHTTLQLSHETDVYTGQLKQDNEKLESTLIHIMQNLQRLTTGFEDEKQSLERLYSKKLEDLRKNLEQSEQQTEHLERENLYATKKTETLQKDVDWISKALEQTKRDRDFTRSELKQYQLDFAKESRALKEVLNQTNQAMAVVQKRKADDDTRDYASFCRLEKIMETKALLLAAEFGRLIVGIAENLTLDDSLKLTMLFNLPPSFNDSLYHVFLSQSPGMKLLDEIRNRNIINMYDVTNIQKAAAILKLESLKQNIIDPYQAKIQDDLNELYKAKDVLKWEDVDAFNAQKDNTGIIPKIASTMRLDMDTVEELDDPTQAKTITQCSKLSPKYRIYHVLYIEHFVGRDGGSIHLGGASLFIPPGVFSESQLIGLSIINEPPCSLPVDVNNARITPFIKLEPLGLMLKKPFKLTIHHSALIQEPEKYGVIMYSGRITASTDEIPDNITWTEERSLSRKLKEKSLTMDIQCLSYLSASLVSQTSASYMHIVRVVPLVDGVRNIDDDIILTICFCTDSDSEYNMLLSDFKTKLSLEQYSTLQLRRNSKSDEDDAGFLSVTVISANNNYVPDAEQEVKSFAISYLCTASRVSHQLRLKKNKHIDRDVVDIDLTFSQAQYEPIIMSLTARIRDLLVSEASENLFTSSSSLGCITYEDLKTQLSSVLDAEQCRKLVTYFKLTSTDLDLIESSQVPGKILMKILEERKLIDSRKLILFFEGLKACHLHETTKLVSEYFHKISEQFKQQQKRPEEDTKLDVLRQRPLEETESIISKSGADVTIPGTKVLLSVPPGALPEHMDECLIKLRIIPREVFEDPLITFCSNSSVVVEILPNNLTLQCPAQLYVPHCLLLKEKKTPTARIFLSHHEEGCSPCWVEDTKIHYSVEKTHCVVWLNSFCWVKVKVDDKEVFAKKLILYTCGKKLLSTDKYAKVAVGYYPDLDGEGKVQFFSLNTNMIVSGKSPFTFYREGSHPLCLLLDQFSSSQWSLWYPKDGNKCQEVGFRDVSADCENQRIFVFEKTVNDAKSPMCIFQASQKQGQQIQLEIEMCLHSLHPAVSHSPSGSPSQPEIEAQEDAMNLILQAGGDVLPSQSKRDDRTLEKQQRCWFLFLKRNIAEDWRDLGRYLDVSEDDLTCITEQYKSDIGECIYKMLLGWQKKNGTEATREKLVEALKTLERKDVAEKLAAL